MSLKTADGQIRRALWTDTRGAAAVEFALVSGLLIFTVLFVLSVALIQFLSQSLAYATGKAARQIMTGAVQQSGVGQGTFASQMLCPYLPAVFACGDVIVNLYTVPTQPGSGGYYTFTTNGNASGLIVPPLSAGSGQFSPGLQGSYEYLQVVYPVTFFPSAFASLLGSTTYNGVPAYPIVATAAFRNEQY